MIRAEVKAIYSSELNENELPEDPKNCFIHMYIEVGVKNSEAADDFTLIVCTPHALSEMVKNENYRYGRGLLIIEEFDWQKIKDAIDKLISTFEEETWEALATKINRYLHWEFEDYQEVKE